jgi:hypothetical protein
MAWGLSLATSQSTNEAANQSTVNATLSLTWNNAERYSGTSTSGSINIGGNVLNFTGPTSGGSAAQTGSQVLASHSVTFTHDVNGARGAAGTSASFDAAPNSFAPQNLSTSGTTFGAINYDRKPAAVTGVTATVNADKSVTVSFGGGASPGGSPALTSTYNLQYSQNGGSFSSPTTGNSPRTITGLAPGSNYVFRVYATNASNDGAGAAGNSTSVFIPSGGKRYDGSSYISTQTAKRYDGSSFVTIVTAKRYDGSNWVNLS